jgi:hypothetical protein
MIRADIINGRKMTEQLIINTEYSKREIGSELVVYSNYGWSRLERNKERNKERKK